MPLGDDNDFRTSRWQVVRRFPGLMERGGDGSAMIPSFNRPSGYSDIQFPPIGIPPIPGTTITLPGISITGGPEGGGFVFPPISFPPITFPSLPVGGETGAGTTITVETDTDTFQNIDTIKFTGSGWTVTPDAGTASVEFEGGSPGGSTLVYGVITDAVKDATTARWTYTVQPYSNGVVSGGTIQAKNLLEQNNVNSMAYGYNMVVPGTGDRITGSNYFVRPVPLNTWVVIENTNALPGGYQNWFSAPNRIDGTC